MKILSATFIIFTLFIYNVNALEYAGEIVKYKGKVKIYKKDDFRGSFVKDNNTKLHVPETIKTYSESQAFINLSDQTEIIVDNMSVFEITGKRNSGLEKGKVLFNVEKSGEIAGFTVKTKTATIGVKGTQFAVISDNNTLKVFLNKGSVSVEAVKGEFKRYVEKEMDEFEAFLLQQKDDYKKYKEKLKKQFVEYVKSFEMKEGTAVSISDNEVNDIKIPGNVKEQFELFGTF